MVSFQSVDVFRFAVGNAGSGFNFVLLGFIVKQEHFLSM
jgi:hypothetical protein